MTNGDKFREKIAKKSNAGLAEFLVNLSINNPINNPCKYCIYIEKTCPGKCGYGIKTWLDTPCEENPPADNEPQEAIPTEVRVDLRKVAEAVISECKEPPTWDLGAADEATPPDVVNKPAHYVKGNMECIDFIRAIVSDLTPYEAYCLGNVVKYLWRFKDKNGVIDLDKAVRYIEFLKEAQGDEVEA